MGFFELKTTCGVCGDEIGLNRFRVAKSISWICPKCLKKAGSSARANIFKITIEELEELVNKDEQKETQLETSYLSGHQEAVLLTTPLKTAVDMYNYSAKNGYGSGLNRKWGVKHFRVIENNLLSGEDVLMVFIGFHNYVSPSQHDGYFAYAITDKRIIMAQKKIVSGETLQTVYLDNLNDITCQSGIMMGIMTISTISKVFNVRLDKSSIRRINSKAHEVIDKLRNTQTR